MGIVTVRGTGNVRVRGIDRHRETWRETQIQRDVERWTDIERRGDIDNNIHTHICVIYIQRDRRKYNIYRDIEQW